jgi:hypothetical protein
MAKSKDDGVPGVRKMEGDIPDFVNFSKETGEIYFSVPEGAKCIQFSLGFDEQRRDWKDEETGKDIFIVWWEIYKDRLPSYKKGIECLKQVAFNPNNKQLKMYARGAEYYPDHCAFGFAYELPD